MFERAVRVGWWSVGLTLLGCNVVLDIDEAELADLDAGVSVGGQGGSGGSGGAPATGGVGAQGGSGGSGGTAGGAAGVCDLTGEACWDCTAQACCNEFAACLEDVACNSALQGYNECLADPPSDGSSCGEIHAAKSGKFLALSQCVILSTCAEPCDAYPLGNLCEPYCSCMDESCSAFIEDKAACLASCPSLSLEQVRCRTLHCTFAATDAAMHCPHALGQSVCP